MRTAEIVLPSVSHNDKNRWGDFGGFKTVLQAFFFEGWVQCQVSTSTNDWEENILRHTHTPLQSNIKKGNSGGQQEEAEGQESGKAKEWELDK